MNNEYGQWDEYLNRVYDIVEEDWNDWNASGEASEGSDAFFEEFLELLNSAAGSQKRYQEELLSFIQYEGRKMMFYCKSWRDIQKWLKAIFGSDYASNVPWIN